MEVKVSLFDFSNFLKRTYLSKYKYYVYAVKVGERLYEVRELGDDFLSLTLKAPRPEEKGFAAYVKTGFSSVEAYEKVKTLQRFLAKSKTKTKESSIKEVKNVLEDESVKKLVTTSPKTFLSFCKRNDVRFKNCDFEVVRCFYGIVDDAYPHALSFFVKVALPVVLYLEESAPKLNVDFFEKYCLEDGDLKSLSNLYEGMDLETFQLRPSLSFYKTGRLFDDVGLYRVPKYVETNLFRAGQTFYVFDLSQYEASLCALLAEEQKVVDSLKRGEDFYVWLLAKNLRRPYSHVAKEADLLRQERDEVKRAFFRWLYGKGFSDPWGLSNVVNFKRKLTPFYKARQVYVPIWGYRKVTKETQVLNYLVQGLGAYLSLFFVKLLKDAGYEVRVNKYDGFLLDGSKEPNLKRCALKYDFVEKRTAFWKTLLEKALERFS